MHVCRGLFIASFLESRWRSAGVNPTQVDDFHGIEERGRSQPSIEQRVGQRILNGDDEGEDGGQRRRTLYQPW